MNQIKALFAVAKADLIATFKNVSSVFFGVLFPMIFILVFGFLGEGSFKFNMALYPGTNTKNPIYQALKEIEALDLKEGLTKSEIKKQLERGDLDAALYIEDTSTAGAGPQIPSYDVKIFSSVANKDNSSTIVQIASSLTDKINLQVLQTGSGASQPPIVLEVEEVAGRKFKQIDYILPGQLGFALLSSGIFGTAFLLVNLRETLVLKRFSATPVNKVVFISGIAISKVVFALIQATVIILAGYFFFGFTLINGFTTFISMLFFATFGLLIFLGMGLVISSIAKDQNTVPPLANLFTMPQFLLAGTFFPIEAFPDWLQPVSRILPLTYLNEALRHIAFDGDSIWDLRKQFVFLLIALVVVYGIAVYVFKWDE